MTAEIRTLLGPPGFNWTDPAPWIEVEREFGIEFPADFREVVDAYGSVETNGRLCPEHPAGHLLHNLPRRVVVVELDSPAWTLHAMTFGEWRSHDLAPDRPYFASLN
ncbi:hypothetical protein [Streptomyces sp. NPDC005374]|uniref:hypothetical protein n=1 Tax=Streptomyces sp. NPDC005374 TaxID=3364713 RepID=UPI00369E37F7